MRGEGEERGPHGIGCTCLIQHGRGYLGLIHPVLTTDSLLRLTYYRKGWGGGTATNHRGSVVLTVRICS